MRVSFLVYGVLYVVVEIVGYQLELVGWPRITPLDVATAVANACLTVAVGIAVLVAFDVGGRHWRRSMLAWHQERARLAEEYWAAQEPVGVTSWRAEPLALPAAVPAEPAVGYPGAGGGRPFPEDPGRLL